MAAAPLPAVALTVPWLIVIDPAPPKVAPPIPAPNSPPLAVIVPPLIVIDPPLSFSEEPPIPACSSVEDDAFRAPVPRVCPYILSVPAPIPSETVNVQPSQRSRFTVPVNEIWPETVTSLFTTYHPSLIAEVLLVTVWYEVHKADDVETFPPDTVTLT